MTNISDYTRQPDAWTCQSAAIAKVLGKTSPQDVQDIRQALLPMASRRGTQAGDPHVMADYIEPRVASYTLNLEASLNDIKTWVTQGPQYEAIIHGFTTGSGHVWGIEDWKDGAFKVDDPWAEFDFPSNRYLNRSGANLWYSDRAIWAYCVVAWTNQQAVDAYRSGSLDSNQKGAWVHFVRN